MSTTTSPVLNIASAALSKSNARSTAVFCNELDAGYLKGVLHLSQGLCQPARLVVLKPGNRHRRDTCQSSKVSHAQSQRRPRHPNLIACYHCIYLC